MAAGSGASESAREQSLPAIDFVPVAVLVTDSQGQSLEVNPAWQQLSRLSEEESAGLGWLQHVTTNQRRILLSALRSAAGRGCPASVETEVAADGHRHWTRWTFRRLRHEGRVMVIIAVVDLDAERGARADLRYRATHDSLTGLVNRAEFLDRVGRAIAGQEDGWVGLIYLDLDRFKEVNDSGGHRLGDLVLQAVGHRLLAAVRPGDVVARVGGDEFAVLCRDLGDTDGLNLVAGRLRAVLRAPIEAGGRVHRIGASTGVAVAAPRVTAEGLLDAADHAMYAAKARREPTRARGTKRPEPAGAAGAGRVPAFPALPSASGVVPAASGVVPPASAEAAGSAAGAASASSASSASSAVPASAVPAGSSAVPASAVPAAVSVSAVPAALSVSAAHDAGQVLQHLYSARISLQSCAGSAIGSVADDLWAAVDELDVVLMQLRRHQGGTTTASSRI